MTDTEKTRAEMAEDVEEIERVYVELAGKLLIVAALLSEMQDRICDVRQSEDVVRRIYREAMNDFDDNPAVTRVFEMALETTRQNQDAASEPIPLGAGSPNGAFHA
jgi:hypothetical protein